MLDAIIRALKNPAAQPVLEGVARMLLRNEGDFERLHWGQGDCTSCNSPIVAPAPPDRLVSLGALHAVEYATRKGDDPELTLYRHEFGREVRKGVFRGPRPVLAVGFYGPDRPEELFIARGGSPYRVRTEGIDG